MWTFKIRFDGCTVGPGTDPNSDDEYDSEDDAKDAAKDDIDGRIASQEGDSPYTTGDFVTIIVDKETGAAEEFAYSEL
jgi:hypothetical protein